MPYYRRMRNRYNRRNRRKYKRGRYYKIYNPLRNRVPYGASPVAKKLIVRLKYSDVIEWDPTTLATQTQLFNMNSAYDPDETGVGHQPYGFDQLAGLFAHYRVYKLSWHIQFAPSNDRLVVCVVPVNGSISPTTVASAGELPLAVTKVLGYGGGVPTKFNGKQSLPRLTGATSIQYKTDDRYSSTINASPTEVMRLNILVFNPTAATIETTMSVTLIYHTEFYDPLLLTPS